MKFAAMRGTLPASWGALAGLTRLSLSGLFTGSLPPAWAGLSALRELRLAGANITAGGLPAEWSALTGLTVCAGGGAPCMWHGARQHGYVSGSQVRTTRRQGLCAQHDDHMLPCMTKQSHGQHVPRVRAGTGGAGPAVGP